MAKEDVVAAGLAAIQSGVAGVVSDELGKAFESGKAEGSPGGDPSKVFSQADLDAAVQVKADADAAVLAQKQADLDALATKEGIEFELLGKLKALLLG